MSEKEFKDIPSSIKLREELERIEQELKNKDDIFGMTLLTNPGYISSSRNIMFTSHLRQLVNLINPDYPKVFTNYENIVGKYSTGYFKADKDYKVYEKISKYEDGINDNHSYLLFFYDENRDYYDVIEKKNAEELTENFGYIYDSKVMDSKDKGSKIEKGEVLYKTSSYDENMNYCYGKNAKFVYMLENNTIEDAIIVSKSFAESMISKEVETVKISLNDNDILCNLYGDEDNYKCFPDINEFVKDKILCSKRRIHNSQLLYDMKKPNLRKPNFTSDVLYYTQGRVIDIFIYCNKTMEEIEDNSFNKQLLKYLKLQNKFWKKVYDTCKKIIKSGSKYSRDISFLYKKAKDILDPEVKWREENKSVFSNMIIEITVERNIPLSVGQKITGRYGNKGVVSKILPDDEMPFLETGERIDIIFNSLGVINRLNSQQLYEQSITFICNRVVEKLKTLSKVKDKEELLVKIVSSFNEKQGKKLKEYLGKLSSEKKKEFLEDVEKEGIYIHNPPLWEDIPMFDKLRKIYEEFDWIKPYDVYVNRFGRKIKVLKPLVVGDMYVIKLKQTSKKNFMARSTGSLSKRGTPDKSSKEKENQELYSKTPIRIGDQENMNSAIGVPMEIIAQLHLFYRNSVLGRRYLGKQISKNIDTLKDIKLDPEFTNRNVEILQAYFKTLGIKLEFSDEKYVLDFDIGNYEDIELDDRLVIGTKDEINDFLLEKEIIDMYKNEKVFIGEKEEFDKIVKKEKDYHKMIKKYGKYIIDISID